MSVAKSAYSPVRVAATISVNATNISSVRTQIQKDLITATES